MCTCDLPVHHPCLNSRGVSVVREVQLWHCMDSICGVCMDSSCGVCVDSSCGVWMDSNCGSGFVFQDCGKLKGGRLSVCVNGRQGVICVLRPCVLMADKAWFVC